MRLSLKKKYREIILSDYKGKMIALLVSMFFWYYVNVVAIEKVYISLPVKVINQPENIMVDFNKDFATRIEISTHDDISRRIENVMAVIDLSDYELGMNSYPIELQNLPQDIKYNMSPGFVRIGVYEIVSKTVPIVLNLAKDSLISEISYSPTQALISGPSYLVTNLTSLTTQPILYTVPITNIFTTNIQINRNSQISILDDIKNVDVVLTFKTVNYTNDVVVPISYKNLDTNIIVVSPETITLSIVSLSSNVDNLSSQMIAEVFLDNAADTGTYRATLDVTVPSNVIILNLEEELWVSLSNTNDVMDSLSNNFEKQDDTLEEIELTDSDRENII